MPHPVMCYIIILKSVFMPTKAARLMCNVTWPNNNFSLLSHLLTQNVQHIYKEYCIAPQIIQKLFEKQNYFLIVPKLRMCGVIPPLPQMPS